MNAPIRREASPPHSAYICCPKCGEEVFMFAEKTIHCDGNIKYTTIYLCATDIGYGKCGRWTFNSDMNYNECVKEIKVTHGYG